MSPETKILLGLSAGAALVTGLLPGLLLGFGAGYVVYRIHYAQSVEELDQILAFVESRLDGLEEHDRHRKTLEGLREKVAAKKLAVRVGSGLVGTGAFLSPVVGFFYLFVLVAVKNNARQKAMVAIDQQIEGAVCLDVELLEEAPAKTGDPLLLRAIRATAKVTGRLADATIGFDSGKSLRARPRVSA